MRQKAFLQKTPVCRIVILQFFANYTPIMRLCDFYIHQLPGQRVVAQKLNRNISAALSAYPAGPFLGGTVYQYLLYGTDSLLVAFLPNDALHF